MMTHEHTLLIVLTQTRAATQYLTAQTIEDISAVVQAQRYAEQLYATARRLLDIDATLVAGVTDAIEGVITIVDYYPARADIARPYGAYLDGELLRKKNGVGRNFVSAWGAQRAAEAELGKRTRRRVHPEWFTTKEA